MKKEYVIEFFGSARKVAEALNISTQSVHAWGKLVPEGSAYKLQVITDGGLKVESSLYNV